MSERVREAWGWRDSRTKRPVSIMTCHSREYAELQLIEWHLRDARGKRPDLHESLPFVEVYRIESGVGKQ